MTVEEKKEILSVIQKNVGTEEDAPIQLKDFLLLPEYKRLQDEQCFLILGERGAGKTCLFNMFCSAEGYKSIMEDGNTFIGLSDIKGKSLKGYDRYGPFATPDILGTALFSDEKAITAYWAGSLLIVLIAELKQDPDFSEGSGPLSDESLSQVLSDQNSLLEPSKWVPFLRDKPETWEKALRWIDRYLDHEYDRLFPLIRTLLSFWYTRVTRWRRILCKIFLRNDLYQDPRMLQFPDASKLKNHQMYLSWKPFLLYQLFVKRLANSSSQAVSSYLDLTPGLISGRNTSSGHRPTDNRKVMEAFIKNLIGEYMGKDPKKGASYSWIPGHLQDADGSLVPRPLSTAFGKRRPICWRTRRNSAHWKMLTCCCLSPSKRR